MDKRIRYIVGIDEVGRGPLAGPLTVGAVLVKRSSVRRIPLRKLLGNARDSKQLSPQHREEWAAVIADLARAGLLFYTLSFVSAPRIDREGMTRATARAVRSCLARLPADAGKTLVLLDGGLHAPPHFSHQETIIGGDEQEPLIALASIIAKVKRDRRMRRYARRYPEYGFDIHKGYGTRRHIQCIKRYGLCDIHRRSFTTHFIPLAA